MSAGHEADRKVSGGEGGGSWRRALQLDTALGGVPSVKGIEETVISVRGDGASLELFSGEVQARALV
jgi:hypothetical protein